MEPMRIKAGGMMGLSDVAASVIPKFGILAEPAHGGSVASRYFMPWDCHPTFAVTGSICTASCLLAPGTVAEGLVSFPHENPVRVTIEHPSGAIEVVVDYELDEDGFKLKSAGVIRTARKLFDGKISIPSSVWR
jgi:hypothetical protein